MQAREFNWHTGRVAYWDLDQLDPQKPIDLQYGELKEDLAQVEFGKSTLLDIGWYPEFSPDGRFVIIVVRQQHWEEPALRLESKDIPGLIAAIRSAIAWICSSK